MLTGFPPSTLLVDEHLALGFPRQRACLGVVSTPPRTLLALFQIEVPQTFPPSWLDL